MPCLALWEPPGHELTLLGQQYWVIEKLMGFPVLEVKHRTVAKNDRHPTNVAYLINQQPLFLGYRYVTYSIVSSSIIYWVIKKLMGFPVLEVKHRTVAINDRHPTNVAYLINQQPLFLGYRDVTYSIVSSCTGL